MFLSDVSIKRPVFATMLMVMLAVLGVVAFRRLAIDEYPDIAYPIISVRTTYRGASPQVIEREVSRPMERALNTVPGIKEVSSSSMEGVSQVRIQFNLGVDLGRAQQEVSSKVSAMRGQLPQEM